MKKLCFVIQRYGVEVNGGAEVLTRELAEKMSKYFEIEVLTSRAVDYQTWKNEYNEGTDVINGIKVRRFSVEHERDLRAFNRINNRFMKHKLPEDKESEWLDKQGPYVPQLIEYIKAHKDDFDLFVFFTYLYYPSVRGIEAVADKAIIVPFAHDEPFIQMKMYQDVFQRPLGICYMTDEERDFIQTSFNNYHLPYAMGGASVDVPETVIPDRFKKKYGLDNYIVYAGRVDVGKNCPEMFDFFRKFKKRNPSDLKLVLMGKSEIEIPNDPDIVSLGFVSEEDKFDGIAGSRLLILPSMFESLSIVVLEAFQLKRPVLVNGKCAVLKGHIDKGGGGYYYCNYYGFESKLLRLIRNDDLNIEMGKKGYSYVMKNYQWDIICRRMKTLIDFVTDKERKARA